MSGSSNRKPGTILIGTHGKYLLSDELGTGGNGKVSKVEIIEVDNQIPNNKKLAVKQLNLKRISDSSEQQKRKKRFIREINNAMIMQNTVKGILPIYDYSVSEEGPEEDNWFIMPQAKTYQYGVSFGTERTLKDCIQIGRTLEQIHNCGFAHRDIKPSNIMFYNGRPVITDFGLVWNIDDECITERGDHVGPLLTRPPELDNIDYIKDPNYFLADVYMFAKAVWILLTGNNRGFGGEYSRGDKGKYIKSNLQQTFDTLEPLNIMFEKATRHDFDSRCSLKECIAYLQMQMDVINGQMPINQLNELKYEETIKERQTEIIPDKMSYTEPQKIVSTVNAFKGFAELIISEFDVTRNLGIIDSISHWKDNHYILKSRIRPTVGNANDSISLLLAIESFSISSDNKCSICTTIPEMFDKEIKTLSDLKDPFLHYSQQIMINTKAEIEIRALA